MLDLDDKRPVVEPRPAATLILLRERSHGFEVCVMQRSLESSFMGGAVVFPGGRVEPSDAASEWPETVANRGSGPWRDWWDDLGIAARVAACREALEEVAVVPLTGPIAPIAREEIAELRRRVTEGAGSLREGLRALGRALDLAALTPLSRWVTPEAEQKRFDARFFVARAPEGMDGSIDAREAIRTFWATPTALLDDYEVGRIALFPPTHRTLQRLSRLGSIDAVLAEAASSTLEVICPRFVLEDGVPILALPGDPLHEIPQRRILGGTRYALRGDRWVSERE